MAQSSSASGALGGLGKFGRPTELFKMAEEGLVDIASTVQGYMPGRFPRSSVMELPLIYDTAEAGTRALWQLYEDGLLGSEYDSVKVLALYVLPPYAILTANADVTSLRDLRGLRLRAPSLTVGFGLARLGAPLVGRGERVVVRVGDKDMHELVQAALMRGARLEEVVRHREDLEALFLRTVQAQHEEEGA